ncbi:MAG: ribonuclease HI family protein [Candidatus Woesebacteria bacterium]|nr:ribonuclease HI family protein [Candidatus Woesebacteria bacterium]
MIIYCDGGSRGNPGPAASAFVAVKDDEILYKESKFLGTETNNVAEYQAVLMALNWIIDSNLKGELIVNLDSQLVERQINGKYKVKSEKLKKFHKKILEILTNNNLKIKFVWAYRSDNELADTLVNEELDASASTGK